MSAPHRFIPTARSMGLVACHACQLLSPRFLTGRRCPRCGAHLRHRKPEGLLRSWAFLIAAMILHVPANLLPIMSTQSVFGSSRDTVFSGVVYFWLSGSRALALLILIPSIVVPIMKMMSLVLLLMSVHFRATWRLRQRTRLYRLLETIGRWSMLDVFVVALLAALVHAGRLATIVPGPGALAFAAVVVLTMLASLSFDPRLLWDALEENHEQQ